MSEADRYGEDAALDELWDRCLTDGGACDELFRSSAPDTAYRMFGATCGVQFTEEALSCTGALAQHTASETYGSNATLDRLWDGCAALDFAACDELFFEAPVDSGYMHFAAFCGFDLAIAEGNTCVSRFIGYGDNPELDALYDECAAGDLAACDTLYDQSTYGSDYEAFAVSCGGVTTDWQFATCADAFG